MAEPSEKVFSYTLNPNFLKIKHFRAKRQMILNKTWSSLHVTRSPTLKGEKAWPSSSTAWFCLPAITKATVNRQAVLQHYHSMITTVGTFALKVSPICETKGRW